MTIKIELINEDNKEIAFNLSLEEFKEKHRSYIS